MSLPYFPMFPSDFEAKTSHLTLAEDGAYNRLLRMCWMNPGCTIPADEAWIMRRLRAHSERDKETVRTVLNEFFTVENGRYSNAKLMQIWLDSNEAHEKRKNAGAKGGKAKSLKNNNSGSSNAVAKPKQPEPEPKKEKELSNDSSKKQVKRSTQLPDGWMPSEMAIEYSKQKGMTDQTVEFELQQFTNHHKQHGKKMKDWDAAWRTWAGNWVKYGSKQAGQRQGGFASKRSEFGDTADQFIEGLTNGQTGFGRNHTADQGFGGAVLLEYDRAKRSV